MFFFFHRWFDKSFQLIIDGNAESSIHFEHAWGDGVAVMRFFNEVHEHTIKENFEPSQQHQATFTKHDFNIDDNMRDILSKSQKKFDDFVGRLSFYAKRVEGFGKNHLKTKKVSPDAIMQLAFQVGFYFICCHRLSFIVKVN